jgi:hypothetical protein
MAASRRAIVWGGGCVARSGLFIWSAARREWVSCPPDEITWLDRNLLSANEDLTLHRAPRCAGLRHVNHRWELFSRDTTHRVYLTPRAGQALPGAEEAQRAARHVLPAATANYEALPVVLEPGAWLVSIGAWVIPLRLDVAARLTPGPAAPRSDRQPSTQDSSVREGALSARRGSPPLQDAVARVRGYFERNATARMAMAYYYQEFILGLPAPHPVPMMDVVLALNLSGEGAVSDYKKLLQGFIWSQRGHARDLADFLLSHGLLTPADLDEARQAATANERSGVREMARQRLRYRPREAGTRRPR